MDTKNELRDSKHIEVKCNKGHVYTVPVKFYKRNVRRKRDFYCPTCLTNFKIEVKLPVG